jgi:nucleotide-binding universal stress UspA family protein
MYKKILVPLDLQETALSIRATTVAQDIANCYQSSISVLTVIPDFGMPLVANFFPEDAMQEAENEVHAELKRFIKAHFKDPSAIRAEVDGGSPHKVIVRHAQKEGIDLIILPATGKDVSKVFLGSSSTHVVERSPCSVLVVRP